MMRPGEPPTEDSVESLFNGLFYAEERYDLSRVGRMKFNRRAYPVKIDDRVPGWLRRFYDRVGPHGVEGPNVLSNDDILAVVGILVELRNGRGEIDDIDHLGNRRLRTIDELACDELRKGFLKLRRTVQERMSLKDVEEMSPRTLVNPKSVSAAIEFFIAYDRNRKPTMAMQELEATIRAETRLAVAEDRLIGEMP